MKKVIFIIISKDIIRRNVLDTDFWGVFIAGLQANEKVVLVVGVEDVEKCGKYASAHVVVETYEKNLSQGWQKLLMFLIRTGVNSHSTRTYRNRAYMRKQSSRSSYLIKSLLANTFGRFDWYQRFLRWSFLQNESPRAIYELFDKYQPVAVFAPSLIDNEFDAQFARVAKQKQIKLIGMVRSWDNLNNHGVLTVVPDVFYFQNKFLPVMAEKLQGIDVKKLRREIVGLPHYDLYFDPTRFIKTKAEFFESIGLALDKKLILLGGSDFYYSEDTLPNKINQIISGNKLVSPSQVLFRPHPSSIFSLEDYGLDNLEHIVLDDAFKGKEKFSDTEKFVNILYHADVIINIASTLSIDAAVFDTPAICINFDDSDKKLSHYEKVQRLYDHFDHYEKLVSTGGARTPSSEEELTKDINEYLNNPELDQGGRKAIIKEFVAPFDGKAGERLAKLVRSEINSV